jgi:hypothetical protein
MRSLSSYPYSQKLTDYWADKGVLDVMGNEAKKEEYVLRQDDVDSSYSGSISKNRSLLTKTMKTNMKKKIINIS